MGRCSDYQMVLTIFDVMSLIPDEYEFFSSFIIVRSSSSFIGSRNMGIDYQWVHYEVFLRYLRNNYQDDSPSHTGKRKRY